MKQNLAAFALFIYTQMGETHTVMFRSYSLVIFRKLNILSLSEQDCLPCHALPCIDMEMNVTVGWSRRCGNGPAEY